MAVTKSIPILRCHQSECQSIDDTVVRESGLRVILNDSEGEEHFAFIHTIPSDFEPLILGLLYTSRMISSTSDILHLNVRNQLARVRLADDCALREKLSSLRPVARLVTGICGPNEGALGTWRACDVPPIKTNIQITPSTIMKATKQLTQAMKTYRETGGTHGAAIFDLKGGLKVVAEDVGRHNAVDRVIGKALQQDVELARSFMVSSGRLTSDLVLKVTVACIPVLASLSAAVDSGIELADAAGITLIGFVRGQRMNIYTHASRIDVSQ